MYVTITIRWNNIDQLQYKNMKMKQTLSATTSEGEMEAKQNKKTIEWYSEDMV